MEDVSILGYVLNSIRISPLYYFIALTIICVGVIKKRPWKGAMVAYCFLVYATTVLCRRPREMYEFDFRVLGGERITQVLLQQVVANILMFVPIGYLIARNHKRWALLSLLYSLIIEISQLILRRGCFEIDDIISNTVGAIIGGALFYLMNTVKRLVAYHKW